MKLTLQALNLLKHVLSFTGETEQNAEGNEVPSSRRLNGEESSQRRHFINKVNPLLQVASEKQVKIEQEYKKKIEKTNPINKKEDIEKYNERIRILLINDEKYIENILEVSKEKIELDINDKIQAVVKKYFIKYGDDAGWLAGDDELVSEIENVI